MVAAPTTATARRAGKATPEASHRPCTALSRPLVPTFRYRPQTEYFYYPITYIVLSDVSILLGTLQ